MTRSNYYGNTGHAHAPVQYYSLLMGLAFLLLGLLGFIPGATDMHAGMQHHNNLRVDSGFGTLLGAFPINVLRNLLHLLFGIWGLASFASLRNSHAYARCVAIVFAILAIMGLMPGLMSTFGLMPLWGNNVWLNALIAGTAAIFGWAPTHARDREIGYGGGHRPRHA